MTPDETSQESLSWFERVSQTLLGKIKHRSQLITILHHTQKNGVIDTDSLRMFEGVLQVSEMMVREIMVPRTEMVVIQKDVPLQDILPVVIKSAHSRFPVIGEKKDDVIGILLAKDLLNYYQNDSENFSIKEFLRPVIFIPENKRLNILLNEFRKNRQHLAIIVDEYGGVSGLITIEDVLEQIVGDIEDEHDTDDGITIRKHKDNTYSIKALTPIKEFNQFFNTFLKDDEVDTMGGLVLKGFGHLPNRGESIVIQGIPFTVLRANHRRIQLLQTTLSPDDEE